MVSHRSNRDHRQVRFCEGLTPNPPALPTSENLAQLQTLFQKAAFWAQDRTLEDLKIAIAHSHPVISVWNTIRANDSKNENDFKNEMEPGIEQLIGFARATSDGIYRATIWDVVIHPDFRGSGLGGQLVQTLLAHPHMNQVERVYLMTTHQQSFYERMGFTQNASTTMMLYQPSDRPVLPRMTESSEQAASESIS